MILDMSKLETIKKSPLSEKVYNNIKKSIVNGYIKPGTHLGETKTSKQLNVSATPVREAFRRLESEGLVKIIPYRGAVVQDFSPQEIFEVYECREALELKAIELAIDNITNNDIAIFRKLLEKSTTVLSHSEYVEINTKMHNLIFENAQNKTLENFIKQIQEVIMHNRTISAYNEKRKTEIYYEHKKIIDSIENKNKKAAKAAMKLHIKNGLIYIQDQLKKRDDT